MSAVRRSKADKLTKEQLSPRRPIQDMPFRHAQHFHDARQLLVFILPGEDGHASIQLRQNTTETPHVNRHSVVHPQYDFGASIETRLNVGVDYVSASITKDLPFSVSRHDDPKSMTLILLFIGCRSKIF